MEIYEVIRQPKWFTLWKVNQNGLDVGKQMCLDRQSGVSQ
ncbi:hypothetical protein W70_247 [Escherichia phage W70]|nr:hypothetical protein W70_247 [Escherichia phage W70]